MFGASAPDMEHRRDGGWNVSMQPAGHGAAHGWLWRIWGSGKSSVLPLPWVNIWVGAGAAFQLRMIKLVFLSPGISPSHSDYHVSHWSSLLECILTCISAVPSFIPYLTLNPYYIKVRLKANAGLHAQRRNQKPKAKSVIFWESQS